MRVISGKYRGRVLETVQNNSIRPTTDRVKENLFNILMSHIQDCNFLDLFCGSGNVGIEALSRGANSVHFNDLQKSSIAMLKKNLRFVTEPYSITQFDYKNYLYQCKSQFDIIFLDPPYHSKYAVDALRLIAEKSILKPDGIAIVESDKPLDCSNLSLECYDQRKYGNIYLTFLRLPKVDEGEDRENEQFADSADFVKNQKQTSCKSTSSGKGLQSADAIGGMHE